MRAPVPRRRRPAPRRLPVPRASSVLRAPGCTLVESGHGPTGTVPIRVEQVAAGLEVPWGIAFLPDGDALVTERPGRVRLLVGGALVADPVATVTVAEVGEGGLLGIAVDPRFEENRRFYLYATVPEDGAAVNRLTRWVLAPDRRSAELDQVLLDGIAAESFHDGGRIRFGPDGLLYVGTGDAGVSVRPRRTRRARTGRSCASGPMERCPRTTRRPAASCSCAACATSRPLTGSTGPRSSSGTTARPASSGGAAVTRSRSRGQARTSAGPTCGGARRAPGRPRPCSRSSHAAPPGGGSVYRGDAVPAWQGSVLFGTLRSRHLHRIALGPDGRVTAHEVYLEGNPPDGLGRIREVVEGPDGALWVTTSNCDGRGTCPPEKDVIVRIVAR